MAASMNKFGELPNEIADKCMEAIGQIVPTKSRERYEKEYREFCSWKEDNNVRQVNEDVLLAYMLDLVRVVFN